MRRIISQAALITLLVASPAWPRQGQKPPSPPPAPPDPAQPSSSASDDRSSPQPSAEEDLDVAAFYMRKGDPAAAIPRLQEAIRLKPNLGKAYLVLAEAYEKNGDKADAAKTYKDYLRKFPKTPDARKIQQKIAKLGQD